MKKLIDVYVVPVLLAAGLLGTLLTMNSCTPADLLPDAIKSPYNGMDLLAVAYQSEILACEADSNLQGCDLEALAERLVAVQAEAEAVTRTFEELFGEGENERGAIIGPINPIGPRGPVGPLPPPPPSPCQCQLPWEVVSLFFSPGAQVRVVEVYQDGEMVGESEVLSVAEGSFSTHTIDLSGFEADEVAELHMVMEDETVTAFLGQ